MRVTSLAIIVLIFLSGCSAKKEPTQKHLRLWYDKPATDWMTEALPFGNGYSGAMFFGGVAEEQIQISEGTLWSGGPNANKEYDFGIRKGAHKNLAKVRSLLKQGKMEEAHKLASTKLSGVTHKKEGDTNSFGDYGAQQTLGDLFVSTSHNDSKNYKREINLDEGFATVSYMAGDNHFERKYYGSYPDRVLVFEFKSSLPADYKVRFETPHQTVSSTFENNLFRMQGAIADNGLKFENILKFRCKDGVVKRDGDIFTITGTKNLTIIQTVASEYSLEYPKYNGTAYKELNNRTLARITNISDADLFKRHREDYQKLFKRVDLTLGDNHRDSIPSDKRLVKYYNGANDASLEGLYFQYNRYLMISSTRPGTMPMTLQGKWNNSINPPWANDYHTNINLQMLYWPAELTNLNECHLPLFNYMESLVEPGQVAAKEFFNTRGWIVNTMNNAYGYTSPGWGFPWGFFPGGAAWLCQHAWEHYDFTQDKKFLQQTGYPLMKEAALFWIDYLTIDENGYLVSCPSYSPEHGGISSGASMDHQMAWDLLNNCVKAAKVLNIDAEFAKKAATVRDKICPPLVGKWGQLQEWKEDVDDPKNQHRHVSHLFALHPGSQISVVKTPKLANAAKTSLNARGDSGTGWSRAWKVNFWARLKDGDHAHRMLKALLKPVHSKKEEMTHGGGTYTNWLCAHPPFQLDGNMGGTAGIVEMLVQSHAGVIDILPALPSAWKNGEVKGLCARGGVVVDIKWKDGKLVSATLHSTKAQQVDVQYGSTKTKVDIQPNTPFTFSKMN